MASIIWQQLINTICNAHAKFQPHRSDSFDAMSLLHLFIYFTLCEVHMGVTHHKSSLGMA